MKDVSITQIDNSDLKASIVSEVLLDLPEWFGLPESTQEYIDQSRSLPLWAAYKDEELIGFVTLSNTSDETAEIHCMGVKKRFHRLGVGTMLYESLEDFARTKYKFMQVKTVDEGKYKEYDQTIAFYSKMGFSKLEVFPTLWDEWNPCLIMIKSL